MSLWNLVRTELVFILIKREGKSINHGNSKKKIVRPKGRDVRTHRHVLINSRKNFQLCFCPYHLMRYRTYRITLGCHGLLSKGTLDLLLPNSRDSYHSIKTTFSSSRHIGTVRKVYN